MEALPRDVLTAVLSNLGPTSRWMLHMVSKSFSSLVAEEITPYPGPLAWEKCWTQAAERGDIGAIRWLHEFHEDCCTHDLVGGAAWYGNLEVIQWLHTNRKERCITTPIDYAVRNGHIAVMVWLRENGYGYTTFALTYASRLTCDTKREKVVELLRAWDIEDALV